MTRPGRLCEIRQGGRPPGGPLRIILGILVVLSLNVFTAPAIAMTAGTRLRVTLPYSGGIRPTVIGAFIGVRSDTLLLGLDPESIETRAIAINDIAILEESRGPRGNSLKAGVVGTLLGALIGGTLGAVAVGSSLDDSPYSALFAGQAIAAGVTVFGVLGATIGGVVGTACGTRIKSERFRNVPVSSLAPVAEQTAPADEVGR